MRKAALMNDFSEVEYGTRLLISALNTHLGHRLTLALTQVSVELAAATNQELRSQLPYMRSNTYLTCFSEHRGGEEDFIGRLSMWRAYGGHAGVALVVNTAPFTSPSDALKAYTSPVGYFTPAAFSERLTEVITNIEREVEFLRRMGPEAVGAVLGEALQFAILSTKHPGFAEEEEWRIIYSAEKKSERLSATLESVRGLPQMVYRIPLENIPEEGLVGLDVPSLVDRIIIGPTSEPEALVEAFTLLLEQAGVPDAASRVVSSDIPLRHAS